MVQTSQTLVKYTPDVELEDPDFEKNLQTVIAATKQYIEESVKGEGLNTAVRDAHAKGYGLARAEVAKVRLPQQDISGDDIQEQMDATSITPWRCTEEHRPLGNIMRARKEVYRQSSILRHELNDQIRREPKNLAEVSGNASV
jgi:hypothetical protein